MLVYFIRLHAVGLPSILLFLGYSSLHYVIYILDGKQWISIFAEKSHVNSFITRRYSIQTQQFINVNTKSECFTKHTITSSLLAMVSLCLCLLRVIYPQSSCLICIVPFTHMRPSLALPSYVLPLDLDFAFVQMKCLRVWLGPGYRCVPPESVITQRWWGVRRSFFPPCPPLSAALVGGERGPLPKITRGGRVWQVFVAAGALLRPSELLIQFTDEIFSITIAVLREVVSLLSSPSSSSASSNLVMIKRQCHKIFNEGAIMCSVTNMTSVHSIAQKYYCCWLEYITWIAMQVITTVVLCHSILYVVSSFRKFTALGESVWQYCGKPWICPTCCLECQR